MFGLALEVAIGCTVNCRASAIIYRVQEFMALINRHILEYSVNIHTRSVVHSVNFTVQLIATSSWHIGVQSQMWYLFTPRSPNSLTCQVLSQVPRPDNTDLLQKPKASSH